MSCQELQSRMVDLVIGAAHDEREEMLAHAAFCANCREALEEAQRLADALRALGQVDGALEASPEVEQRVLAAWDEEISRGAGHRLRTVAVAALATAAAVAFFVVRMQPGEPGPVAEPSVAARPPSALTEAEPPRMQVESGPRSAVRVPDSPLPPPPDRSAGVVSVTGALPETLRPSGREVVTFVPLWPAEPDPAESLQIMRVRLSRASLAGLGVAVDEPSAGDDLQADVLLGEDGVARAIRLVQFD